MNQPAAAPTFTAEEIADAQTAFDLHPDSSSFWDSAQGQDALYVARRCKLAATTTNRERVLRYAEFKRLLQKGAA